MHDFRNTVIKMTNPIKIPYIFQSLFLFTLLDVGNVEIVPSSC